MRDPVADGKNQPAPGSLELLGLKPWGGMGQSNAKVGRGLSALLEGQGLGTVGSGMSRFAWEINPITSFQSLCAVHGELGG